MRIAQSELAEGERVEVDMHPHRLTLLVPTFVGVLLVAGAVVAAWITPDDEAGNRVQWILVVLLVLLAIPFVLVPYLRWRTTHYVVTTRRVLVRHGIVRKEGKDITLAQITEVSFEQSLVDRLINAGSLRITSAGDSRAEVLRNIPDTTHVQQVINRLVDADEDRRRMVAQAREAQHREADGATAARPEDLDGA